MNYFSDMVINKLILFTKSVSDITEFYQHALDLKIKEKKRDSAEFKIGHTQIQFRKKSHATPYHFAINIPSNKAGEALIWLKERVTILRDKGHEIINFKSWNAKSIYFYDNDKNIVELIARGNLEVLSNKKFDQRQFLGISEIGLPVDDIAETYFRIQSFGSLNMYDGSFDTFCAAGDENGLFIIIDRHKKRWFPVNDEPCQSDFIIEGDYNFKFINGDIVPL